MRTPPRPQPSLATVPRRRALHQEHNPWDLAWRRALDELTTEILTEMFHLHLDGATIERLPDFTGHLFQARQASGRTDIIHVTIQLGNENTFEQQLIADWVLLDERFPNAETHRIRQLAVLPTGAGRIKGEYRRGGVTLGYAVLNVPEIPAQELLAGPLPSLALFSGADPSQFAGQAAEHVAAIPNSAARTAVIGLGLLADEQTAARFVRALQAQNIPDLDLAQDRTLVQDRDHALYSAQDRALDREQQLDLDQHE